MKNVTKERALVLRKALVELHNSCPDDTKTQDLIDDLLNGQNVTYMAQASELKEQNRELVEALREIRNSEHGTYKSTPTYLKKVASDAIENFLTKHQKDV